MPYNPAKHHRRSIRLKNYDYAQAGAYFVTLVTFQRQCLFGEIVNGEMNLNKFGVVVESVWKALPVYFSRVQLDTYVIMPNHFHGLLFLVDPGKGEASAKTLPAASNPLGADASPLHPIGTKSGSISAVVQNFKSVSARRINANRATSQPPIWQATTTNTSSATTATSLPPASTSKTTLPNGRWIQKTRIPSIETGKQPS